MNDRILATIAVTLMAVLGAHLAPLILPATAVAIIGTTVILAERITTVVLRTGWAIVPARKARTSW